MQTIRQPAAERSRTALPGVMFLIDDLGVGGAERALINLVNRARGFRPVVALLRPVLDLLEDLDPGIEVVCLGRDRRHPHAAVPAAPRGLPRGLMPLEIPRLLRLSHQLVAAARRTNCGVVSTFLNRSHTVALTARALFAPSLRIVVNVHEILSDHLARHFAPPERRIMRSFVRHFWPRADRIVTVADAVTQDLVSRFGLREDLITVARNPLDLLRIVRSARHPVEPDLCGANTVVAVGRLVHLKGFDLLVRAMARLPVELDAHLVIIGGGPERPALERLVAELSLGDRVTLLGISDNPWCVMARAAVVAVPSRTEAFPTVIGEALALGIPVVATRCSEGVAEYLERGRCGVLVAPENVDALAVALASVLEDEGLREHLANAGPRRVQEFDASRAARRYESLLLEVAG